MSENAYKTNPKYRHFSHSVGLFLYHCIKYARLGFLLTRIFPCKDRITDILPLYVKMQVSKNPYSCIFVAVLKIGLKWVKLFDTVTA